MMATTALLVDRDDSTRQRNAAHLTHAGIETTVASDGREALAMALSTWYDVVVTDFVVPGINGYELCELLRLDADTRHVALIILTDDPDPVSNERSRVMADAVIVKPCMPQVLLTEMRKVLERSRDLRQRARQIRARVDAQLARSNELHAKARSLANRYGNTFPKMTNASLLPSPPASVVCPECYQPLLYKQSHVGGVGSHREQWDYYDCPGGCGTFQYRPRTRKVRKIS